MKHRSFWYIWYSDKIFLCFYFIFLTAYILYILIDWFLKKVEMDSLKHTPNWNYRHRRDSVSGLSSTSQPIGYPIGTHSPAPTYHSQGIFS